MDRLQRQLAPVSDAAWELIDAEASRALRHYLTARALVDFSGPKGWQLSAYPTGRFEPSPGPTEGVESRTRSYSPVVELQVPFSLERQQIDSVDRGSRSPDLDSLTDAARLAAGAEDRTIFSGGNGIKGLATASPHDPVALSDNYDDYPRYVASAVARLRRAGVGGPYAIALGDRCYTGVIETTEHGGYPVLQHLRLILGGAVLWAPKLDGAIVASTRGGDFEMISGGDFAVGFSAATPSSVELYLEESFTFVVHEPKAAVALSYS